MRKKTFPPLSECMLVLIHLKDGTRGAQRNHKRTKDTFLQSLGLRLWVVNKMRRE